MDRTVDQMPLRAGNLARVSKIKRDGDNRVRSTSEQREENRAEIDANGWLAAADYEDTESASRFARREREDWLRLLEDIENDRLDVVVLWEPSRGSRELEDWIAFLRRCREHDVLIHVTIHNRTYDVLRNARDWRSLAEDGLDAAWESEKTSERVKRHLKANKEAGMPHGIVKYGFRRVYAPNRALLGQEPVPEHAAVVREVITRIANGDPISVIRDDLNRRGIPSAQGLGWQRKQVARMATCEAYIGKIRVDGELIDARWPAIVDEDVFWAASHMATGRKTYRPGKAKYLLSYLMTCAGCGSAMEADPPRKRMITPKYRCSGHPHCSSVPMGDADAFVTLAVRKKLSEPGFYRHLVSGSDERVVRARAQAARLRAELDEWATADISAHAYSIREAKLLPLIEGAERQAEELAVPLPLRDLAAPGQDVQARWDAMPVAARRDVIRLLFPDLRLLPGSAPAYQRVAHGTTGLPGPVSALA
jgi:DNA invertase Pin-like site-specific DNA recombinase